MKCSRSAIAVLLLVAVVLVGCDRRQAMYKQPKFKPYQENDFFADKRSARPLVEGTVARGVIDDHLNLGVVGGNPVTEYPFAITRKEIERGMNRFNIYCTPCHSRTGDGWGMVVQRGLKRPPSFHEARLKAAPVGYFFNVITNGFGQMSGYSAQIKPEDRWAIIAYVRALQQSQDGRISDVPPAERAALEASK
jgi:mono/diheme cytochrome c family protein